MFSWVLPGSLVPAPLIDHVERSHGRAELGLPAHTGDVLVDDEVVRASYEAAILAPLGPLDAHALLDLDDPVERLERVVSLLRDEIELLQFRLSG